MGSTDALYGKVENIMSPAIASLEATKLAK